MKSVKWFKTLTTSGKISVIGLPLAIVILAVANASPDQAKPNVTNPTHKPAPSQGASQITTKPETETQSVPFTSVSIESDTMAKGTTKITTTGVNGSQTLTYNVTYKDGKQTDKKLVGTVVTASPVTQVTSVGTYVAPAPQPKQTSSCDPNYSGACVPIASDVDCAGGGGNGPAYVSGPVRVVGSDIYGLDRDGDGVGCE